MFVTLASHNKNFSNSAFFLYFKISTSVLIFCLTQKVHAIELEIENGFQSARLADFQRTGELKAESELLFKSQNSVQDGTNAKTSSQIYIPRIGVSFIQKTPSQTATGVDFESRYHFENEEEKSAPYAQRVSKFSDFKFGLETFVSNLAPVDFHLRLESHLFPLQKSTFDPGQGAIKSSQNRKFAAGFKAGLGIARRTPRWTLAMAYYYGQQLERDFETVAADGSKISGSEKLVFPSTIEATVLLPNMKETQLLFSCKVMLLDNIKQENATESAPFQNSFEAQAFAVFPSFFPASVAEYFPLSAPQFIFSYRSPLHRSESTMDADTLDKWTTGFGAATADGSWKWNVRLSYAQDTQKVPEMAHKYDSTSASLMILKTLPMSLIGE